MSGGGTGKRASTRGGGAGKRAATAGGGTGRRAPARADSVLELDDDQVVEIAEVSEPRMLVGPVVHVVCHEASAGQLGALRGVVASLGLRLLAEASGADLGLALAALRGEPAPDVVIAALPTGEPLVRAALALAPGRPVVVVTAAGELRGPRPACWRGPRRCSTSTRRGRRSPRPACRWGRRCGPRPGASSSRPGARGLPACTRSRDMGIACACTPRARS